MLDKVMSIICLMCGVAALSMEFNKLRQCSSRAAAKVTDVVRQTYRGLPTYCPVIEFIVDGRLIRSDSAVPGSMFKNRYRVGDTKTVFYDPVKPERFRLRGNYNMLLIGAFFLLGGIYLYMR